MTPVLETKLPAVGTTVFTVMSQLATAYDAVVRSGDEVVVLDPCYDSYEPAIVLGGGTAVHVSLADGTFAVDWARGKAAITRKTRMRIVNTPHNPTGPACRLPGHRTGHE